MSRNNFDDERSVPRASAVGELEWTLRYGVPTRADLLFAASVCSVYTTICASKDKRQFAAIAELASRPEQGVTS